jgi:Fe-S-cluster containining protein
MHLGDYIVIERELAPFTFACESVSTGTPFTAVIDEDKRELFLDGSWISQHPAACRFLRPSGEHILCTIHQTSPIQCRFYRCVVMRIYDKGGAFVGKVTGTLALHSDDPVLREIRERTLAGIPEGTAGIEELLQRAFEARGYLVG